MGTEVKREFCGARPKVPAEAGRLSAQPSAPATTSPSPPELEDELELEELEEELLELDDELLELEELDDELLERPLELDDELLLELDELELLELDVFPVLTPGQPRIKPATKRPDSVRLLSFQPPVALAPTFKKDAPSFCHSAPSWRG